MYVLGASPPQVRPVASLGAFFVSLPLLTSKPLSFVDPSPHATRMLCASRAFTSRLEGGFGDGFRGVLVQRYQGDLLGTHTDAPALLKARSLKHMYVPGLSPPQVNAMAFLLTFLVTFPLLI